MLVTIGFPGKSLWAIWTSQCLCVLFCLVSCGVAVRVFWVDRSELIDRARKKKEDISRRTGCVWASQEKKKRHLRQIIFVW